MRPRMGLCHKVSDTRGAGASLAMTYVMKTSARSVVKPAHPEKAKSWATSGQCRLLSARPRVRAGGNNGVRWHMVESRRAHALAASNPGSEPAASPERASMRLTVPGASEAEIARGLDVVERHFAELGVSPYAAAVTLLSHEQKQAPTYLENAPLCWVAWHAARYIAVAACCEGWRDVPWDSCDLWLTGIGPHKPVGESVMRRAHGKER